MKVILTGSDGSTSIRVRLAPSHQGWLPQDDLPDTGTSPPHTMTANHFINEIMDSDGVSTEVKWRGGPGTFSAFAGYEQAWDGATVRLQFSLTGGTQAVDWADVPGMELSFNQNDAGGFQLGPCLLRVKMEDAGDTTELRVRVVPSYQGWLMDAPIPSTA